MWSPGVQGPRVTVFCSSTASWAEVAKGQNRENPVQTCLVCLLRRVSLQGLPVERLLL